MKRFQTIYIHTLPQFWEMTNLFIKWLTAVIDSAIVLCLYAIHLIYMCMQKEQKDLYVSVHVVL